MTPEMSLLQAAWEMSISMIQSCSSLLLERHRKFLVDEQSSPIFRGLVLYFVGVHIFRKHLSGLTTAAELDSILGKTNLRLLLQ